MKTRIPKYLVSGSVALILAVSGIDLFAAPSRAPGIEHEDIGNRQALPPRFRPAPKALPELPKLKPDLVPLLHKPMNGLVRVKNQGAGAAGPSLLTLDCRKRGHRGGGGGCPDAPGLSRYSHPAYPDKVVIKIPALPAGKVYEHKLVFWNDLVWTSGIYGFVAIADVANTVDEAPGGETNNTTGSTLNTP